jgi:hypothetical protein
MAARTELWGGVFYGMAAGELRTVRPNSTEPTVEQKKDFGAFPHQCALYEEGVQLIGRTWQVCYEIFENGADRIVMHSDATDPGAFGFAFLKFQDRYGAPLEQGAEPLLKGFIQFAKWKEGRRLIDLTHSSGPYGSTLAIGYSVASDEI